MKVKMFTKTVCPTCKIAKQQLTYVPVPVEIEEYNIETDKIFVGTPEEMDAQSYLVDCLDSMSTPTFLFEDGTIVRGFEMGQIQEALGL